MRNFSQEFKEICAVIDSTISNKCQNDYKPAKTIKLLPRMFNIHKRSLPPKLDIPVIFNIESKLEAIKLIENARDSQLQRLFDIKLYHDNSRESKTYIFYEPVPTDATPHERSIYFNEKDVVKEEGSDLKPLEIILTDNTPWVG